MKHTSTTQTQPAWFFWFFAGYTALVMIAFAYLAFDFITHPLAPDAKFGSVAYRLFLGLVMMPLGLVVSILVLRRAPRNINGLFLLMWAALIMQGTLRADAPVSAMNLTYINLGAFLLPFFFPDGRVSLAFWQRWVRLFWVIYSLSYFLRWTLVEPAIGEFPNPLSAPLPSALSELITTVQINTFGGAFLLVVPSLLLRYRAANFTIRQQIKWFVLVYALLTVTVFVFELSGTSNSQPVGVTGWILAIIGDLFATIAPFLVVGMAILRHRLYDIDIIIRRTLIYSVLTAILAIVYFGAIILTQQLFRAATGETPDIAIVISTLLIAALFSPIRRRVQNVIDSRLYRRKYDVEKTLAAFQQNLRDEVDMETLKANLVGVVNDTMQPNKIALWVKENRA